MKKIVKKIISASEYITGDQEDQSFNEWMYEKYSMFPDDLTDDDYDMYYNMYMRTVGDNLNKWPVDSSRAIKSANYGGAYDIDPDMFFTKEEIVEFGDDLADQFSAWAEQPAKLYDVYVDVDAAGRQTLHVEVECEEAEHAADVYLDFRKIRKPSDINKFADSILKQWKDSFLEYHQYDEVESATNCSNMIMGRVDPEPSVEPPYRAEPDLVDTSEDIVLSVDTVFEEGTDGVFDVKDTDWAEGPWNSYEFYEIKIDDDEEVADKAIDLLLPYIPDDPGSYKVKAKVVLHYDIRDINLDNIDESDPQIDYDYKGSYVDDVEVTRL